MQLFPVRALRTPLEETAIVLFDTSPSESLPPCDVLIEATLEAGADVLPDDETLIGLVTGPACTDSRLYARLLDNWFLFLAP